MSDTVSAGHTAVNITRGTNVPLVPFLYGVARQEHLPGVVLVRLLTDLGLTVGAARSLIARMRGDGLIIATPRRRGADYHLTGNFLASFRQLNRTGPRPEPPPWDGHFHAIFYTIPEAERPYRDRLRRAALLARYGIMQPGILISPTDRREQLVAELGEAPRTGTVYFGRLQLPAAEAARVAFSAWGLHELNRRYVDQAAVLRAAIQEHPVPPAPGGDALRVFATLLSTTMIDVLRTPPQLPSELLPAGWALPDLFVAIDGCLAHFGPPASRYVHGLLAEQDG